MKCRQTFLFYYVFVKMENNYKVKNVSVKTDSNWKLIGYSVIVCAKSNEDYTTAFFYTPEDALKFLKVNNQNEAKALVWQSCQVLKTLKIA